MVGGEVQSSGTQITNEVLVLPVRPKARQPALAKVLQLNATNPSFSPGLNEGLPPHAFAAMSLSKDESALIVVGGMTTECSSDALVHSFDLSGNGDWAQVTPSNVIRRRGAGMTWVDNNSTNGEMMLVGGIADSYTCGEFMMMQVPPNDPSIVNLFLPRGRHPVRPNHRGFPCLRSQSPIIPHRLRARRCRLCHGYKLGWEDLHGGRTVSEWRPCVAWKHRNLDPTCWVDDTKYLRRCPSGSCRSVLGRSPIFGSIVSTQDRCKFDADIYLRVLHGGSVLDNTTNTDSPTALLAFLNTTTWSWSTPSNLQPPLSSSTSYHSSVMTTSGVMITAFGLGSSGNARSDVFYLDMRDPSGSGWTWKSYWKSDMLGPFTSNTVTTNTNGVAATNASSAPPSKKIAAIAVPFVIGLLLVLPVIIYFIWSRVRIARKRRMARHFSFSSQEDNGDFSSPIDQFRSSRKTKTRYPFGQDANEKAGNFVSDLSSGLISVLKRYSRPSSSLSSHRDRSFKGSRMSEKAMNWEEIDFGLGKLDERRGSTTSRRSSFSATSHSPHAGNRTPEPLPFAMPVASTVQGYDPSALYSSSLPYVADPLLVSIGNASPRVGTPRSDGQMSLVPSLVVMPPSMPVPDLQAAYPAMAPSSVPVDGLDWNLLQQELDAKPAFRSISPTSTLRSHAHPRASSPTLVPARAATPPYLLPLELQRSASPTGTITLVNPKTGRRTSETLTYPQSPRSVSQPLAGRQLAGSLERRESAPFPQYSPSSTGSSTPTGRASYDPGMRRSSNPSMLGFGTPAQGARRESVQSKLRVVNDTEASGQAL